MMLDLPAFGDVLAEWLKKQTHWRQNVQRFSLNLLDDLKPRSYTRDLDWGIPVPLDGWRDRPDKRIYVWFDAVVGYLSASIEWAARTGNPEAWRAWWQSSTPPAIARGSTTSWARTTSSSMPRSGRRCCSATRASASKGGTPGTLGALDRPYEVVSSEFLTMEGQEVLVLTRRDHLRR